jgi:hypothetical protein
MQLEEIKSICVSISKLIQLELLYHRKVDEARKVLEKQEDFSILNCYYELDQQYGYIKPEQMLKFMNEMNQ